MRQRIAPVLTVIALAPLLMGGGGPAPGVPSNQKLIPPTVSGIIVVDPHDPSATFPTGKQASIWVRKGALTAGEVFDVTSLTFPLALGCDLTLTNQRFLNRHLDEFIPFEVVDEVFRPLGISVTRSPVSIDSNNVPIIVDISSAVCTPNEVGGNLTIEVTIQFLRLR